MTSAGVILPETGQFLLLCSLQLWQQLQRSRQTRARVPLFLIHFTSILRKQFAANGTFLRETNSYKLALALRNSRKDVYDMHCMHLKLTDAMDRRKWRKMIRGIGATAVIIMMLWAEYKLYVSCTCWSGLTWIKPIKWVLKKYFDWHWCCQWVWYGILGFNVPLDIV